MRVFENRVQRKIPGPTKDEGSGDKCIMSSLIMCTHIIVHHDKANEVSGRI
jgi:hypothetical protein